MTVDIAALGLKIESDDTLTAKQRLEMLAETGKRLEGQMTRMASAFTRAAQAAGGMAAIFAARRILVGYADAWSDMSSRVGLAIQSMEHASVVMERLTDVARRTYSPTELTTEAFLRNATVLRELGKSVREQLDFTEALNNSLVISGAKGERAAQVQEALGRAMAIGTLRGQELNTVVQTGGRVAELLAEQLGVGVNQLRSIGAQGKITGAVIYDALTSRIIQLREEAEAMPATVSDAITLLQNSALQLVGVYDQGVGVSETLARAIILLADNLNVLVQAATVAVLAFGGRLVSALTASAKASAQYYHAIATGSAVVIGSATAEKQRAAEVLKSAGATANATLAKKLDIQATIAQLEVTMALATVQRAEASSQVERERAQRAVIASRMALRNAEMQLVEAKLAATAADKAATAAEVAYQAAASKTTVLARAAAIATGGLSLATGGLSLAMRGLSAALALVGGPVGLLFTVLTAMWIYKDRAVEIGNTTISVGNILDAIWTTVKETVIGTVTAVGRLGTALWQFVTGRWLAAAETATTAWDGVGQSVERVKKSWNEIDVTRLAFAANMPSSVAILPQNPNTPSSPSPVGDLSAYDKAIEQTQKRIEGLKIEASTYDMAGGAAARYQQPAPPSSSFCWTHPTTWRQQQLRP